MIWLKNLYFTLFISFISLRVTFFTIFIWLNNRIKCIFVEWSILNLRGTDISILIIIDPISIVFSRFVIFISRFIMLYRRDYIHGDINLNRFLLLISLFVASIIFLIFRPNLVRILLGWDGLGLTSYALVIYYQNSSSSRAGILTVLSNRVGDIAILIRISYMFLWGSYNYTIFNLKDGFRIIIMFVILAAFTKSAQIPFSAWLPAAMAAPTPVRALVHSSTLVTAGVYLIVRFRPVLTRSGFSRWIFVGGVLTIFISGIVANFEFDLKKIIALSTLRQLGVIITRVGLRLPSLAIFHLLSHALFKSMLFITAGIMIHASMGVQDLRKIGHMGYNRPIVSTLFLTANLALCGIPFLAGFYSKDLILERLYRGDHGYLIICIYIISIGFTVSYTIHLSILVFFKNVNRIPNRTFNEGPPLSRIRILGLFIGRVTGGACVGWLFLPSPSLTVLSFIIKNMTFLIITLGFLIGFCISKYKSIIKDIININRSKELASSIWFLTHLTSYSVPKELLIASGGIEKTLEKGWLEWVVVEGACRNVIIDSRNKSNSIHLMNIKSLILMFFLIISLLVVKLFTL